MKKILIAFKCDKCKNKWTKEYDYDPNIYGYILDCSRCGKVVLGTAKIK